MKADSPRETDTRTGTMRHEETLSTMKTKRLNTHAASSLMFKKSSSKGSENKQQDSQS